MKCIDDGSVSNLKQFLADETVNTSQIKGSISYIFLAFYFSPGPIIIFCSFMHQNGHNSFSHDNFPTSSSLTIKQAVCVAMPLRFIDRKSVVWGKSVQICL